MKKRPPKRVIRLRDQTPEQANDNGQGPTRRSAIVEPKRKRSSTFGDAEDMTPEEYRRPGDAADALFRRATLPEAADGQMASAPGLSRCSELPSGLSGFWSSSMIGLARWRPRVNAD